MSVKIIRRCRQCRGHFEAHTDQRWCPTCWAWRMVGWHFLAAQRVLRSIR
jgi:hypothetical protein